MIPKIFFIQFPEEINVFKYIEHKAMQYSVSILTYILLVSY